MSFCVEMDIMSLKRQIKDDLLFGFTLYVCVIPLSAFADNRTLDYLAALSIEDLSHLRVTSVSKQEESLSTAPASIFVITKNDIRRSGAFSLPEVLRLAPNLQVSRTNTSQYAISARGFNDTLGNKLLVLVDGRTIYTAFHSGVYWDAQDVVLEDIERIEIISGAGATLWGANAVNGVINIITKSTQQTHGTLVTTDVGNQRRSVSTRYGDTQNHKHYRVYAKKTVIDPSHTASGATTADAFDKRQVGFRSDWDNDNDKFTLQGDAYSGESEQPNNSRNIAISGLNLLGRWTHELNNNGKLQLQSYYDLTKRNNSDFDDNMEIADVEFQHILPAYQQHNFQWGAGLRFATDYATNTDIIAILPTKKKLHWANIFLQDEITLQKNLALTIGSKWENNSYTGTEFLPSVRLAWQMAPEQLVWTSLSHAVRAPARLDRDFYLYYPLGNGQYLTLINGGANFESETANVFELGYRAQYKTNLSYSITAFYSQYDKLRGGLLTPQGFEVSNAIKGTTRGVEGWANYQVMPDWLLSAGFLHSSQNLEMKEGYAYDANGINSLGSDPNTWQLRSLFNLSPISEFDVTVRHVNAVTMYELPAYTAVDCRLGWQINPNIDLSLVGQNLFDSSHAEFGEKITIISKIERNEYPRSVLLKLVWQH